jgi:hypothetical protein
VTQKLEELFDLDKQPTWSESVEDILLDETEELAIATVSQETLAQIEKIEMSLPVVRGLEASDAEMDELATKASEAFANLMDLGMNVESRNAAEIFSVASNMLGHAITAKNAKVNKKLKMIELQLKQVKLSYEMGKSNPATNIPAGTGTVVDRNELLRQVLEQSKETKQ